MYGSSKVFLQEINEQVNKLKDFTGPEALHNLAGMRQDMESLLNKTESPAGIPPPDDLDCSYSSLSSSISVFDVALPDQICHIKDVNNELRKTATLTLKDFKNTSRSLLSKSQLQSEKASLIIGEAETVKKLIDASDESKSNKNESGFGPGIEKSTENDADMAFVYEKIQEIQKEISEAAEKLRESEKMILSTEEKNFMLENRIKKLEESICSPNVTEGPEKSKNENCVCIVV